MRMMTLVFSILVLFTQGYSATQYEINHVDAYVPCGTKFDKEELKYINVVYVNCAEYYDKVLSQELSQKSSSDKKQLVAMVKKYMEEHKLDYQKAFKQQFSIPKNIKKYPAFVFNDKYIVYGLTDYKQAKEKYYDYRG